MKKALLLKDNRAFNRWLDYRVALISPQIVDSLATGSTEVFTPVINPFPTSQFLISSVHAAPLSIKLFPHA